MNTNEKKSRALAILAGFLSLAAYVSYNYLNTAGKASPNISSWAVWAFITILNFTSYKKMTGDWVKSALPTASSIMCIVTVITATYTGSIRALSTVDQICFWTGVLAGLGWWISKSAVLAQVLLEVALVIGFIPTITGVWHTPSGEPTISWLFWTASFATQFFVVKYTWRGKLIDFLYPVNLAIFHGAVFVLTLL